MILHIYRIYLPTIPLVFIKLLLHNRKEYRVNLIESATAAAHGVNILASSSNLILARLPSQYIKYQLFKIKATSD